jgi:GT2 family glycosyltransferase
MEFQRREELGVWINHHPFMGLDPALDPQKSLAIVPAVTGACLAIRRTDFDAIGGWDTGYLIGDFEDSDMCLKLRSVGKSIAYLPTVQLTHLERQSFRLLGQGEFRTKVVVYNAFRHQSRWGDVIESLTAASAGAS